MLSNTADNTGHPWRTNLPHPKPDQSRHPSPATTGGRPTTGTTNTPPRPCMLTNLPFPAPGATVACRQTHPLGTSAGPLLNGRWILYYAALGFDILTYKTVRSRHRACYPMPNLQPGCRRSPRLRRSVACLRRRAWQLGGLIRNAVQIAGRLACRRRSHAPRSAPQARSSPCPWSQRPNRIGRLTTSPTISRGAQNGPLRAALIASRPTSPARMSPARTANFITRRTRLVRWLCARQAVGSMPLLIKIGHVTDETSATGLAKALAPHADALVMTNCIAATVLDEHQKPLFDGQRRGIAGEAIGQAVVDQVRLFARVIRENRPETLIRSLVEVELRRRSMSASILDGSRPVTRCNLSPPRQCSIRESASANPPRPWA